MNIPEQCKPLKKSYDDCFNENMSNMYSSLFGGKKQQQAGQTVNADPNLCEKVFEVQYRDWLITVLLRFILFSIFSSLVLLFIFHTAKQFKSIILYCIVISLTLTTTD